MGAADLDAAKKALLTLLQKKVDARPKDEVGLVLIGARDTKNALVAPLGSGADVTMDEDGADAGYAHVHSVHDLDLAAIAHMKTVDGLERSEAAGSYIDGLIVALDLLHKRKAQKKMNGRILVVTNAACAAEELEDLDAVVGGLVADGVEVEVWGIGFGGAEGRSPAQRDNEAMFASLAARTGGGSAVHAVAGAADMMALACAAPVRPTPLFRGALEVGCIDGDTASGFKVAVYCYARTKAVGLPSLKKIKKSVLHAPPKVKAEPGAEAVDSDDELTGGVVRDSTYRALHDIDIEVPPQQRLKGYTYGRKPITYTKEMEAAMKWRAAKRLVVLGFVPTRSIARTRYIGTTDILVPDPRNPAAATALGALVCALRRTQRVAIARFVKRANSVPIIAVLVPSSAEDDARAAGAGAASGVRPLLFVNQLPYCEDVRGFHFDSLDAKEEHAPSAEQLGAAESLIRATNLSIARDGGRAASAAEALEPRGNLNPVLQRFYQTAMERANVPGCPVPPVDPVIAAQLEPQRAVWGQPAAKGAVRRFREVFPLERTAAGGGGAKRRRRWESTDDAPVPSVGSSSSKSSSSSSSGGGGGGGALGFENAVSKSVGATNTVADFSNLVRAACTAAEGGGASDALLARALDGMELQIRRFVDKLAVQPALETKVVECLEAYRASTIAASSASMLASGVAGGVAAGVAAAQRFNAFLRRCRDEWCEEEEDLWDAVKESSVALISNVDVVAVGLSAAEASALFSTEDAAAAAPHASLPPVASAADEVVDEDDLLDGLL